MKSLKLFPGILAVGIYFFLIFLIFLYFNTSTEDKSKRYVKKNENRIQVAISSSSQVSKPIKKPIKKTTKKPVSKIKKVIKKKKVEKKVKPKTKPKPKPKLKPKPKAKVKPKKQVKPKDLFANVSTKKKIDLTVSDKPIKTIPKKDIIKVTDKKKSATQRINDSLKNQKTMDSGVEDAYRAKVEGMLKDWPAQSDYAGKEVKVILHIDVNGFFEFEIKSASTNPDFNQGLELYLEQLQEFGFGRHKGNRTYIFQADFIAKG